jgi:glycosyltransferase involved in cell wall biosynthesis
MSPTDVSVLAVSRQPALWGAERQLLGLAPGLADRGVTVTLAAPGGGPWLERWLATGLPGVRWDPVPHGGLRAAGGVRRPNPGRLVAEGWSVGRAARAVHQLARGHDVVLSVSLDGHPDCAVAGRLARRPTALLLVDVVRPGLGRRVLRGAARWADLTIANSRATAQTVAGAGRVELVHPGVDLGSFTPGSRDRALRESLGAGDGDVLVGIVGRLDAEKGVHVVLEAVRQLASRSPEVKLAVVGDVGTGPASYAARLHAAAAPLGDRVCFAGRRDDIPQVMRALDVLVCASSAEPFGLSILEAQACGVPVIATAAGGVTDLVTHGRTGLLVAPGDTDALCQALHRLVADPDLRHALGAQGCRQARSCFDHRDQFDRYATLFRGLAGRRVP